jgi:NADH-quinone oxidoreductase subunit C
MAERERGFDESLADLEAGAAGGGDEGAPRGEPSADSSHPSVLALRAAFGDAILHHTVMAGDEHVVYIAAERNVEVLTWLRDAADQRYDLLLDVTAVDYGGGRPLEVVYQLWSISHKRSLRLKATLPLSSLEIASVVPIWGAANWLEREVFDLFGIHFAGHPDLRRIMMPDNYAEGYPLRKDFPLRGRFSRAEQTRRALAQAVEDHYTPAELAFGRPEARRTRRAGTTVEEAVRPQPSEPHATPPQPTKAEGHALGASGSAVGGAPAPGGGGGS